MIDYAAEKRIADAIDADPLLLSWQAPGLNGHGTCWQCGERATREFCYAGEPWTPYCTKHQPQYETAGDRELRKRK